jgi:hypothetical protein
MKYTRMPHMCAHVHGNCGVDIAKVLSMDTYDLNPVSYPKLEEARVQKDND